MWGLFFYLYVVTIGDYVRAWIESGKSVIAELEASSARDRIACAKFEATRPKQHKKVKVIPPETVATGLDSIGSIPDN